MTHPSIKHVYVRTDGAMLVQFKKEHSFKKGHYVSLRRGARYKHAQEIRGYVQEVTPRCVILIDWGVRNEY